VVLAGLSGLAAAWAPIAAVAETVSYMYGVADDNNIYAISPLEQAVTGTISTASLRLTGTTPNAFALDRNREQMLFLGSNKNLYFWDRDSDTLGQVATANDLGLTGDIPRDASFYDDKFWFFGYQNNTLNAVPILYDGNGIPTGIGTMTSTLISISNPSNFLSFGDIAINPVTQTLYGSTLPMTSGGRGEFFSLQMSDLANSYTVLPEGSGKTLGLQLGFDKDYAKLYGQDFETGDWYEVNTTTGAFTSLNYASPSYARLRDVAGGLVAVPEPGTLALACAGIAIPLGMGWTRGRRRKS
jgi:hypothetical protein